MSEKLKKIAEQADALMKDSVAVYLNKSNALVNGNKTYISEDKSVMPYKREGKVMLPVGFFLNSVCETNKHAVNSEIGPGGVEYAAAEELCSLYGKFLHIEDNGLIIYGKDDISKQLNWQSNMHVMRRVCESFMFDDVSGEELKELIVKKHPNRHHPRLLLSQQKIDDIKNELSKPRPDAVYAKMLENLKAYGEKYLTQRSSGYEIRDGIRLLYVCRENGYRMLICALLYLLTDDERYAKRAYLDMYNCACFVDWNPYHFLDVGEMSMSVGLCYDWLYNWMNENERKYIREGLFKNGIMPIIDDFDDKPRKRSWNWRGDLADNWCLVISGVGVAAMSIIDELDSEQQVFAQRAMEQTLLDIRRALSLFAPLGGYEEGFNYWGYAMEYFSYTIASLKNATGSDFGYVDIPGMRLTNRYMLCVNGSVSVFSYHDSGRPGIDYPPQMMFLADYFENCSEALPRINCILTGRLPDNNDVLCDMLWYNPKMLETGSEVLAPDAYLPITEVATMRSGWEKDDMFVGFHCDNPIGDGKGHSHFDVGTFVIDALGETFFIDLGADNYNLHGDYINAYRVRAEGHNVIVFNPGMEYGQKHGGTGQIIKHSFNDNCSYAVGELSNAYDDDIGVISYLRGVKLSDGKKKITVQDEIRLSKKAELWWFAHTEADIEISSDGREAVLTKNGKKLKAVINCSIDASFGVMDAVPLPTSPVIENQIPNNGIRKLTIHFKDVEYVDLAVSFYAADDNIKESELVPIENWNITERLGDEA